MIVKPEIIQTKDGSKTLYVKELDEHYHSTYGAITESRHVFIEAGLKITKAQNLNIFEMGYGTGLNAFLTLIEILESGKTAHYTGMELNPVDNNILESLNYGANFQEKKGIYYKELQQAPWNQTTKLGKEFSIEKIQDDIINLKTEDRYDLVYFDAFGPDIQPELWTTDIFLKVFRSMRSEGILTTYSSKGQVRRNMKEAGFQVEKIPGPPGKRDMTRAWKQ